MVSYLHSFACAVSLVRQPRQTVTAILSRTVPFTRGPASVLGLFYILHYYYVQLLFTFIYDIHIHIIALTSSHSRCHIDGFSLTSADSRHHIHIITFTSSHTRHHIHVFIFTSSNSRHHIYVIRFTSSRSRHHIHVITFMSNVHPQS